MIKDKIKALISKEDGKDNKKKIENIAVFIVILIITIIAINLIFSDSSKKNNEQVSDPNKKLAMENNTTVITSNNVAKDTLSAQLEEILTNIDGVGKVKVLITYSQTSKTLPMYNEDTSQKDTEETDTNRWN